MSETVFAVLDETNFVVNILIADQEFIDLLKTQITDSDVDTEPYTEKNVFVDVTAVSPRPSIGWYKMTNDWVDTTPTLTTDRMTIPPDGTTAATISFTQKGPKTPTTIDFDINGARAAEPLTNGVARIQITSTNPGDMIVVTAGSLSTNIKVGS